MFFKKKISFIINILICFLFNIKVFSSDNIDNNKCELKLICYVNGGKYGVDGFKLHFFLEKKKYSFADLIEILNTKFEKNEDNKKEEFRNFIEMTQVKNYSELIKKYKILSVNNDYKKESIDEEDISNKDKIRLMYSYEIYKEYNFSFYDLKLKDEVFKRRFPTFTMQQVSELFKNDVKKLNDFLNKKKLLISFFDVIDIVKCLDMQILDKLKYGYEYLIIPNLEFTTGIWYEFSVLDDNLREYGFIFYPADCEKEREVNIHFVNKKNGDIKKKYNNIGCLDMYTYIEKVLNEEIVTIDNVTGVKNDLNLADIKIKQINNYTLPQDGSYLASLEKFKYILVTPKIDIYIEGNLETYEDRQKKFRDEEYKRLQNYGNDKPKQCCNCCSCC